ncbi:restriction endonuclease subunit S [Halomonas sp. 3F2F]|uniref:restriction endonuclease subunit S n=1 Tax=Halomonas sp. 3F2F TaxID=1255602 RepID=UPI00186708BC|nr:restriction endonuclease subunit S [Halomonas sp. 3F2F]
MSNLKKYRFCELYTMSSGISSAKDQAGHGSPFLSFSVVFNNYFVPDELTDLMATSDKEKDTYSVKSGDIFLTRTSEVVDELAMSCVAVKDYPSASYSGFLKRLRPKQTDITYSKFMAFYLRSPMFRKTMTNNAVMTLRASLNEAIFSYLDLLLPDYDDQVKAGDLLYLLNEKIELNKRINAELEAMAKTLYDYWFLQFNFPDANGKPYKASGGKMVYNPTLKREIPDEWEAVSVENIVNIKTGKEDANYASENGKYHFFTCGESLLRCDHYVFDGKAVLLAGNGSFSVKRYDGKFNAYQRTYVLIPAEEELFAPLYFAVKDKIKTLTSGSRGSIVKFITKGDIKDIYLPLPKDRNFNFLSFLTLCFSKSSRLSEQDLEIASLRDWLLPMLMNGQVTIE